MTTCTFHTLGCKVNQYETEEIKARLLSAGLTEVLAKASPDLHIINTCAVTRVSEGKSRRLIRRVIKKHPGARVVVTGCYVNSGLDEIRGLTRDRDLVVPQEAKARISGLLGVECKSNKQTIAKIPAYQRTPLEASALMETFSVMGSKPLTGRTRAVLKIQDGCNLACSYCIVRLVRGPSRSKLLEEVYQEALTLVKSGFKEIVLTGIDLGSYGRDLSGESKANLVGVLKRLLTIPQIARLRLSSLGAKGITSELLDLLVEPNNGAAKICPHFHIPLQSGSNRILKKMNRRYQVEGYLDKLTRLREVIPNPAITTDIIVGFPGEADKDFSETLDICEQANFSKIHIFPYSRRPGTRAADFTSSVPASIIKERVKRLNKLADKLALRYKQSFLGQEVKVLIEGKGCKIGRSRVLSGLTDRYLRVMIPEENKDIKNQLIRARITEVTPEWMLGRIV